MSLKSLGGTWGYPEIDFSDPGFFFGGLLSKTYS